MTEDLGDWRVHIKADTWAGFDETKLINAYVKACEDGDRTRTLQLKSELEALRTALRKVVPRKDRVDGIEETPDFMSPKELIGRYTDPEIERHMKWAAHILRRVNDVLQVDFSDPKPQIPAAIKEAEDYLKDWLQENGSPDIVDPAYLLPTERNTPLWHAMSLHTALNEMKRAFALVEEPGAYRIGKRDVLLHMAEVADAAARIGRHYEILRRKWSEPLAVSTQKQVAGRRRAIDTSERKNGPEKRKIIDQFDKLIARGVSRAGAVTQIVKAQDSGLKRKDLKKEKNRVSGILRRNHKTAWEKAKKHTP